MLDSLAWFILDATADDWESIDQILPHVHVCYGSVEARIVASTLVRLARDGLLRVAQTVEAGDMTDLETGSIDIEGIIENPSEFWFCMTPRGRILWDSEGRKYLDEPAH